MTDASLSSFANQDYAARLAKAEPIARSLSANSKPVSGKKPLLLDIGTGSGVTGKAVAEQLGADYILMDTTADAIVDRSHFVVASGESMPFRDGMFNFIIANHVIEHVIDQTQLLREIHRVLTPTGVAYMATPSKYTVLEPHYKLPFLSWMPQRLADRIVRAAKKGDSFKVSPLRRGQLVRKATIAGLRATDWTANSIVQRAESDNAAILTKLASKLPSPLMRAALPIAPSHIWLLSRSHENLAAA